VRETTAPVTTEKQLLPGMFGIDSGMFLKQNLLEENGHIEIKGCNIQGFRHYFLKVMDYYYYYLLKKVICN